MSTSKFGIKGRAVRATVPSTGMTIDVSTFGWMFQYTSSQKYGPYSMWAIGRCERARKLFEKRAVNGILPYVVETHADGGSPDKKYTYEVRKNCPRAFFVEAWSENKDGKAAFGKLVGYLRWCEFSGQWEFVTSYIVTPSMTLCGTVPVCMGDGVLVNIPLRRIIYHIEEGKPHATYILEGKFAGHSVLLSGDGNGEGYQVHLRAEHFGEAQQPELDRLAVFEREKQVAAKAQEVRERVEADLKRKTAERERHWQKVYDEAQAAKQKATALLLEYEEKLAEANRLYDRPLTPPLPK